MRILLYLSHLLWDVSKIGFLTDGKGTQQYHSRNSESRIDKQLISHEQFLRLSKVREATSEDIATRMEQHFRCLCVDLILIHLSFQLLVFMTAPRTGLWSCRGNGESLHFVRKVVWEKNWHGRLIAGHRREY
jgi:hypothetical protein